MATKKPFFDELKAPDSIGFIFSSDMKNIDYTCEKITQYLRTKIKHHRRHRPLNRCTTRRIAIKQEPPIAYVTLCPCPPSVTLSEAEGPI